MGTVPTVRGEIDSADLGQTLMHEHVVTVTAEVARDYPDLSWTGDKEGVLQSVVAMFREVKSRGSTRSSTAPPSATGANIEALQQINDQVDLHIVACTGIYTYDYLPFFFLYGHPVRQVDGRDVDILTEMFVRDVTEGIAGSGIKAGMIKTATDHAGVTPNIERILRAVARAHRATGAPITTHTAVAAKNGLDQQRIFSRRRASTSGGSSSGTAGTRPTWPTCGRSSTPARRSGPTASASTCRTWACPGWTSGWGHWPSCAPRGTATASCSPTTSPATATGSPETGPVPCSTTGCRRT